MASRASELPPGRSVTAGIIIVGNEILKLCLELKRGKARYSLAVGFHSGGKVMNWDGNPLACSVVGPNILEEK